MDKTILEAVREAALAALQKSLTAQAVARKQERELRALLRLDAAEAALEAARQVVEDRLGAFEGLEKKLEAARGAAAGALRILRGTMKGAKKAWGKAEKAVVVYHDRLDAARHDEEAAYAAYARLQSARRALRAAAITRDAASHALYRAESAPVVVRLPVWASRYQLRKADEASVARRAELTLVIDQLSRAQAEGWSFEKDLKLQAAKVDLEAATPYCPMLRPNQVDLTARVNNAVQNLKVRKGYKGHSNRWLLQAPAVNRAYQLPETQVSVVAVKEAAKVVGRAAVEATSVTKVFEALRKDKHRFDNSLGKLLSTIGLKTLEHELTEAPVNTVTHAIDVLFGNLPADTKERATTSMQRKAATQAFRALKAGAFDITTSHWAETALVGNARLFASCCGFRLLGDTVAEAPASGVNPANEIDRLAKTAGEEETGETEGEEAMVYTGKVDPDTLVDEEQPAGYEEVTPTASDVPEGINWAEWTLLSTANSDREVSMAKGHEATWDGLLELYNKTKVVSKEAEFREVVSAAEEVYNLSLFDGLDQ